MKVITDNITACLDKIGSENNPRIALEVFNNFKKQLLENKQVIPEKDHEYFLLVKAQVQFNQMFIPLLENVTFKNLFETMENKALNTFGHTNYKGFNVSEYCNTSRNETFKYSHCKPSKLTLETISNNMLAIAYDSIYFECIEFDTFYRVYANYNQIIGSRLIAIIQK